MRRLIQIIVIVLGICAMVIGVLVAGTLHPMLDYRIWTESELRQFYKQCKSVKLGDTFENTEEAFKKIKARSIRNISQDESKGVISYSLEKWSADICTIQYEKKNNKYLTVLSADYWSD